MRPPRDEAELVRRCDGIAGETLGAIAAAWQVPVPADRRRAKGWTGTLIEQALGASAASRPVPDFTALGIELKTLPLNRRGEPRESTYVCTVPLGDTARASWSTSAVRRKLARVLWVPFEADPELALAERRVGVPLIWSPSAAEENALRADWEELMDLVCLGRVDEISAHHGQWLQIRPKAANSRARRIAVGRDGTPAATLPRGFYLRTAFTAALLRAHYAR